MWGSILDTAAGTVKNRLGSNLQQSLVDAMGIFTYREGCILDGELDLTDQRMIHTSSVMHQTAD